MRPRQLKGPAAYQYTGKMTAFVAGFSEVKLKLPKGIPLASGLNIAETISDDLYARAMVLQLGDYRIAILSSDLFGVPGRFVTDVRNIAHAATKRRLEDIAIMITATHTYHSPALPNLFPAVPLLKSIPLEIKYEQESLTKKLAEQLGAAVIHAWNNLVPVSIKIGSTQLDPDTMHNRRTWDQYAGNPDLEIITLEIIQAGGPSWVLFNVGMPSSLNSTGKTYSADIFGEVARRMKQKLGNDAIIIPLVGAAGNIEPGTADSLCMKINCSPQSFHRIAQNLCEGIEHALHHSILIERETLRNVVKLLSIPISDPKFADNHIFLRITGDSPTFKLNTQVQGIQIGDVVIIGLPGEPMASIGHIIKNLGGKLGFRKVVVTSLANDFIGYSFSQESFDTGGYETLICASREAGKIIINGAEEILEKLKSFDED